MCVISFFLNNFLDRIFERFCRERPRNEEGGKKTKRKEDICEDILKAQQKSFKKCTHVHTEPTLIKTHTRNT